MNNSRYIFKRRTKRQLAKFRRELVKAVIYFIFCGLIFTGLLHGATAIVNSALHKATAVIKHNEKPAKAYAESPKLSPTPVKQAENWDDFIASAMKIAPIYNFPVKVLLSQAALESGHGTSHYAQERNNYFGMNAVDWNPDAAYWYENQEQSIIDYIITIRANFPEAWANRNNPEKMLYLMESNDNGMIYATDPDYVGKVMNQPEWRNY